jgi:hypothetical protein
MIGAADALSSGRKTSNADRFAVAEPRRGIAFDNHRDVRPSRRPSRIGTETARSAFGDLKGGLMR